jgi:hypothetical protein
MLWQKLIGTAKSEISYVGGAFLPAAAGISATNSTISLTGLTGGISSSAVVGDIVILAAVVNSSTNLTFSASGYTSVADLFEGTTSNDVNLGVFYKVLTAADTTANISWGSATALNGVTAYVWRGVNAITPLDATSTTAVLFGGTPDSPSITTVTANAVVISIGGCVGDAANYVNLTAPSGMGNYLLSVARDTSSNPRGQLGMASVSRPTSGAYNPAAFGGGFTGLFSSSSAAVTMALRPA